MGYNVDTSLISRLPDIRTSRCDFIRRGLPCRIHRSFDNLACQQVLLLLKYPDLREVEPGPEPHVQKFVSQRHEILLEIVITCDFAEAASHLYAISQEVVGHTKIFRHKLMI